jgi:hypothetical protein
VITASIRGRARKTELPMAAKAARKAETKMIVENSAMETSYNASISVDVHYMFFSVKWKISTVLWRQKCWGFWLARWAAKESDLTLSSART